MHKHSAVICFLLFLAGCASMEPVVSEPYDKAFPIVLRSGAVKLEVDATRPVMSADQENAVAVLAGRAISIDPDMVLISYPDTLEGGAVAARISQIMVSHGLRPEVFWLRHPEQHRCNGGKAHGSGGTTCLALAQAFRFSRSRSTIKARLIAGQLKRPSGKKWITSFAVLNQLSLPMFRL